jgi:hypothetical protein
MATLVFTPWKRLVEAEDALPVRALLAPPLALPPLPDFLGGVGVPGELLGSTRRAAAPRATSGPILNAQSAASETAATSEAAPDGFVVLPGSQGRLGFGIPTLADLAYPALLLTGSAEPPAQSAAAQFAAAESAFAAPVAGLLRVPREACSVQGGETSARARFETWAFEQGHLGRYLDTRNGLVGPDYSTKLAPWLACGCISPRRVYWEVKRFEAAHGGATKSTYWIAFELRVRDFFRFVGLKV